MSTTAWIIFGMVALFFVLFAVEIAFVLHDWFFNKKLLVVGVFLALSGAASASAGQYTASPPRPKLPAVKVEGVPPIRAQKVTQGFTVRQQIVLVYAAGWMLEGMGKATPAHTFSGSVQASFLRRFGVQLQAEAFDRFHSDMDPGEAFWHGFLIGL